MKNGHKVTLAICAFGIPVIFMDFQALIGFVLGTVGTTIGVVLELSGRYKG